MGSGRAEAFLIEFNGNPLTMEVLGELGGSSRVVIDLPKGHAWFGAGGEAKSPSPASDQSTIRLDGTDRLDACLCHGLEGFLTGERSVSLKQDGFV